ncbi:heparinase II/III family protein [Alkaliphilus metalliredigens]|nr:heparinase II/III family protein [Alkaliphilus metalliredigens]
MNTIKYLKPSQGVYRLTNRLKRELYKRKILVINTPSEIKAIKKAKFLIPSLDFDSEYLNRFDIEGILNNEFDFINISHKVSLDSAWNDKSLQHLWRYNLHYFEYLYKLGFQYLNGDKNPKYYEKYKELIINWIVNNPCPYGDGWHPYTISLRITNWITTYELFIDEINNDIDFRDQIAKSLYTQYSYLQKNLEKDVLGNHYFENIKALIIGSIFFGKEQVKSKFTKELLKQLEEQILEDGMHFELTPMYHKIILEDLIKITVRLKNESVYAKLSEYIKKMIDVMYSFEEGFGKTPAFNDSTDGISKNYDCLLETCKQEFDLTPKYIDSFKDSGYYILRNDQYKLILDCGEICPSYLPAHGHCDALSYELSMDGIPILVNSGTYQYEGGEWRNHFRKTKAHNTVMIGNREQSQFWGSFRVANRISDVIRRRFNYKGLSFISGAYKTYFGAKHTRYIGEIDENVLLVLDKVEAKASEEVRSYVHLNPNVKVSLSETVKIKKDSMNINIIHVSAKDVSISKGWYSSAFNLKEENEHIVFTKSDDLDFFGYLICLKDIKCNAEISNDVLTIRTDKEFIINLNKLGEKI